MRRLVALAVVLAFIISGLGTSTAGASGCSLVQEGTLVIGTTGPCTGVVTIPGGVTAIGDYAFSGAEGLTSVIMSNSVTSIGDYAFLGAISLANVTIGSSVTSIGEYAFYGARALTRVVIPNSVTSIGKGAFTAASTLASVTIGSNVTLIDDEAFSGTALRNVVIPNSVTSIGASAFAEIASLTSVTIGNGVISIGNQAFAVATSLSTVIIGQQVASIGDDVFNGATALVSVRFLSDAAPTVGESAFAGAPETATAIINPGATGFLTDDFGKWNGLLVETATAELLATAPTAEELAAAREAEKQAARAEIINLFRNSGRATLRSLNQAEIFGITSGNIDQFHTEILALSEAARADIIQILKVARKHEVVGIITSVRVNSIYSNSLIEIGLIPSGSKHKAALTEAIKNLPVDERTSYAAIKEALDSKMAEIQARKDRLSAILARITSRRAG